MRISTLAAACLLAFGAAAHADVILVDDFNSPGAAISITDNTIGGPAVSMTQLLTLPNLATSRTVTVNQTSNNSTNSSAGITATVGGGSNGVLDISVASRTNGTATVAWTIPTFTLGSPAAYTFNVLFSALGSTANAAVPNNVNFVFTGGAGSFNLPNQQVGAFSGPGSSALNFNLTNAQAGFLSGGGSLSMVLTGGDAWNLTLDSFAITVPEPTSLALVGLALVGAGLASRRRQA